VDPEIARDEKTVAYFDDHVPEYGSIRLAPAAGFVKAHATSGSSLIDLGAVRLRRRRGGSPSSDRLDAAGFSPARRVGGGEQQADAQTRRVPDRARAGVLPPRGDDRSVLRQEGSDQRHKRAHPGVRYWNNIGPPVVSYYTNDRLEEMMQAGASSAVVDRDVKEETLPRALAHRLTKTSTTLIVQKLPA